MFCYASVAAVSILQKHFVAIIQLLHNLGDCNHISQLVGRWIDDTWNCGDCKDLLRFPGCRRVWSIHAFFATTSTFEALCAVMATTAMNWTLFFASINKHLHGLTAEQDQQSLTKSSQSYLAIINPNLPQGTSQSVQQTTTSVLKSSTQSRSN